MGKGTEEEAIAYYHKWTEQIKSEIPADKLLVFEAKEGWEPLCKFLGVDEVPSEPYPRVNDTKQMQDMVQTSIRFCNACYIGLPTLITGAAALLYYWC